MESGNKIDILKSNIRFLHFYTSHPGDFTAHANNAFLLWKKIWSETFDELEVKKEKINSDDFCDKELCGLFLDEEPIGFILIKMIPTDLKFYWSHSYFNNYPNEIIEYLDKKNGHIQFMSYLTIQHAWRKKLTTIPISEIVIGLGLLRLTHSNSNCFFGYFRNERSTNQIFYRHGGSMIRRNIRAYNVDCDFGELRKENVRLSDDPESAKATAYFWNTGISTIITKKETISYEPRTIFNKNQNSHNTASFKDSVLSME